MTLTDMAKQLGVTTMTIYRRCEKNGVNIADLRDGAKGPLTSEGVAVIASMFDTTTPQTALTGDATPTQPGYNPGDGSTVTGPLDDSTAVLRAKLDGMTALVEQLTGERDALREQLAAAQAALAAEQADRQSERRYLTGGVDGEPAAQPRRRWRWPWARD